MEYLTDNTGPICATVGALTAVTGLAATYYLNGMPDPNCLPPIDLNDQTYVLEVRLHLLI